MPISYVRGDATRPKGDGPKILAHICNDVGGWGKGFVLAVSKRWRQPEAAYRAWARAGVHEDVHGPTLRFELGHVQLVEVGPQLWVANMVAQRGYGPSGKGLHRSPEDSTITPPIRYDALARCLMKVGSLAMRRRASVHMPRIGTGLAGGTWDRIEPLIQQAVKDREVAVVVYDWP